MSIAWTLPYWKMLYICARLLFCASEPSSWKSVNGEAEAPGVKGLKWLQLLLSFALSEDFTETKLQVLSFLSSRILSNSEWFSQFFFPALTTLLNSETSPFSNISLTLITKTHNSQLSPRKQKLLVGKHFSRERSSCCVKNSQTPLISTRRWKVGEKQINK